jgi:hypothetical protein
VFDQIGQHREPLPVEWDHVSRPLEFVALHIEPIVAKNILHGPTLVVWRPSMLSQAASVSQISALYQVFVRLFLPRTPILCAGERKIRGKVLLMTNPDGGIGQ